nr:immunoglobulin heavy chain junction region [Mus musculus]
VQERGTIVTSTGTSMSG